MKKHGVSSPCFYRIFSFSIPEQPYREYEVIERIAVHGLRYAGSYRGVEIERDALILNGLGDINEIPGVEGDLYGAPGDVDGNALVDAACFAPCGNEHLAFLEIQLYNIIVVFLSVSPLLTIVYPCRID